MKIDYNKPQYLDNAEHVRPFAARGDSSIVWLETRYNIARDKYVRSPVGTALNKKTISASGRLIFRKVKKFLDANTYHLLEQRLEQSGIPRVDTVVELWGYLPTRTFKDGGTISWTRPGYKLAYQRGDDAALEGAIEPVEYNGELSEMTLSVTDASIFPAGTLVRLHNNYYHVESGTGEIYEQMSTETVVVKSDTSTNQITVSTLDMSFTATDPISGDTNSGVSNAETYFGQLEDYPLDAVVYIAGVERDPLTTDFPCIMETEFFIYDAEASDVLPEIIEPFGIYYGRTLRTQATMTTTPTSAEYLAMIEAGDILIAQQPQISKVAGDIWQRITPKVLAQ